MMQIGDKFFWIELRNVGCAVRQSYVKNLFVLRGEVQYEDQFGRVFSGPDVFDTEERALRAAKNSETLVNLRSNSQSA